MRKCYHRGGDQPCHAEQEGSPTACTWAYYYYKEKAEMLNDALVHAIQVIETRGGKNEKWRKEAASLRTFLLKKPEIKAEEEVKEESASATEAS